MSKNELISIFILLNIIFILVAAFYSFAEERITLTTYYPAPYGVYREIRVNQMAVGSQNRHTNLTDGTLLVSGDIILGTTAFTSVQGNNDCPDGYEIYTVRWRPKECVSPIKVPSGFKFQNEDILKCTTGKFVWASCYIPKCAYCIEAEIRSLSVSEKQMHDTEADHRYRCTKKSKCVAEEREYTICVKEP
ncbi:MAG: hypothetical protein ISS45_13730 [Candidatus Omnitrophica bacterium]|nr:hypothetical protein [Candidatus Omnitrophota bacterium]